MCVWQAGRSRWWQSRLEPDRRKWGNLPQDLEGIQILVSLQPGCTVTTEGGTVLQGTFDWVKTISSVIYMGISLFVNVVTVLSIILELLSNLQYSDSYLVSVVRHSRFKDIPAQTQNESPGWSYHKMYSFTQTVFW